MKDLLRQLLARLREMALCLLGNLLFLLLQVVQLIVLLYLGFKKVYGPIADSPGARDGMGLIFVIGVVFIGAVIGTTILATLEAAVIRWFYPDWEPPDFPG